MSNLDVTLKDMMLIDGAIGAAVVDYESGMPLGMRQGSKALDLEVAVMGSTEVVRAKLRTLEQLGLDETIEDILVSLSNQYHVIRPMTGRHSQGMLLYLVLDRASANLALARHRLRTVEHNLEI
ncbi:hypothetical protein GFY24_09250 [Nocardia sp. SYP-A9097]|uniref:hypothetical protein n=1 Tax=Nocardia sp. SYP-A9097 TaxID=2663237 RepID=UPI00129BF7C8|nr:hypothetical protein [Nocardia sp. SYP-A9097]MRH87635.1 hypothetical protein [Nocardia sp. SYP-A9097]